MACRKACPGRRRRTTWLSRVGRSQGHNRSTRTGRQAGAGKGQRARTSVRARASEIRLQTSASNISCLTRAQAKRGAREGWTTRAASQDTRGELLRPKRGAVPKEGVSDRGKPSLSREAGEAISIPWAPRKPTCKGGSVTCGVTGRQRQSREWSETAFWDRRPQRQLRPGARAKKTLLVAARSAEAGPERRETTDPPIAPFLREWTKRVGSQERGYRVGRQWLAEVGRTHRDAHAKS